MLKKEIFLSNGEPDGYEFEYCDQCGAEAPTKLLNDCYQCQDCRNKERDRLGAEYIQICDILDAEQDEAKAIELQKQLNQLEIEINQIP